jgi:hypothetical protein
MTLRVLLLALSVAAAALAGTAQAQGPAEAPDEARIAAAKEMLAYSGAVKQFDEAMPLIFGQLSRSFTAVAPGKAKEIRDVFDKLIPRFMQRKDDLIEQIARLYAAELTLQELNAIIAFYKSPAGLRFAGVQPKIVRESVLLGQRWGERIGAEIAEEARQELKKRGIDL